LHANCYIVKPPDINATFLMIKQMLQYWFMIVALPQEEVL